MKVPILISEPEFKKYMERVTKMFADPTFMNQIVHHVSNGGSILQIAREIDCSYQDILRWIRMDKERSRKYDIALNDRNEFVIETVLNALRAIKEFDLRDLYDSEMRIKPMDQWPADARYAVSSLKPTENGIELKMADRLKAIELVGKNKAMFNDRVVHEAGQSLTSLIMESWENGTRDATNKEEIKEQPKIASETSSKL